MSSMAYRFGQVIRENRRSRALSQEALADLADLNRSYLARVERGLAAPSVETMQKLADGLGEKLSSLIAQCEDYDD